MLTMHLESARDTGKCCKEARGNEHHRAAMSH